MIGGGYLEYNELLIEANTEGVSVDENFPFKSDLKGLYIDRNIALSASLKSSAEKTCILAEELGHHYTSFGDILDQHQIINRRQEQQARTWAYNKLIGLIGIIDSYNSGCRNIYEMAEHLNVTEKFLLEALERYQQKYGHYATLDNYIIYFQPCVAVMELQL